jgi:hypothetical protein
MRQWVLKTDCVQVVVLMKIHEDKPDLETRQRSESFQTRLAEFIRPFGNETAKQRSEKEKSEGEGDDSSDLSNPQSDNSMLGST